MEKTKDELDLIMFQLTEEAKKFDKKVFRLRELIELAKADENLLKVTVNHPRFEVNLTNTYTLYTLRSQVFDEIAGLVKELKIDNGVKNE